MTIPKKALVRQKIGAKVGALPGLGPRGGVAAEEGWMKWSADWLKSGSTSMADRNQMVSRPVGNMNILGKAGLNPLKKGKL